MKTQCGFLWGIELLNIHRDKWPLIQLLSITSIIQDLTNYSGLLHTISTGIANLLMSVMMIVNCICVSMFIKTFGFNPLMPELNPFAQRCLTRFFTWNFSSWTVHFVNICVKNQQMQLFIQFINYVWQLLHVSALRCHLQGAFLVPSERCSIEEQSIEYCGWACCF
jgi:hypothetical protein